MCAGWIHKGLLGHLRAPQPQSLLRVQPSVPTCSAARPQPPSERAGRPRTLAQPAAGSRDPTFLARTTPRNTFTWCCAPESPLCVPQPHPKFCFPNPSRTLLQSKRTSVSLSSHFPTSSPPPSPTGTGAQRGPGTHSKAPSKNHDLKLVSLPPALPAVGPNGARLSTDQSAAFESYLHP